MMMFRKSAIVLILTLSLCGCAATYDPVQRAGEGAVGGAAAGCGIAALMTIWTGPGAAMACGMGAAAGAAMGGMMGVATTPQQPAPVPWQASAPPPYPLHHPH
jgi:hypothetical protein